MSERDAVEIARDVIARVRSGGRIADEDALTIARALLAERESKAALEAENAALRVRLSDNHEGWKRCGKHDSWFLLPDAECPSCEIDTLREKVARLEEAGDKMAKWCVSQTATDAWTAAKSETPNSEESGR